MPATTITLDAEAQNWIMTTIRSQLGPGGGMSSELRGCLIGLGQMGLAHRYSVKVDTLNKAQDRWERVEMVPAEDGNPFAAVAVDPVEYEAAYAALKAAEYEYTRVENEIDAIVVGMGYDPIHPDYWCFQDGKWSLNV